MKLTDKKSARPDRRAVYEIRNKRLFYGSRGACHVKFCSAKCVMCKYRKEKS